MRRIRGSVRASGVRELRRRPSSRVAAANEHIPEPSGASLGQPAQAENPTSSRPMKARASWKRRVAVGVGLIGLLVAAYGGWVLASFANFEGKIYHPRPATATPTHPVVSSLPSRTSLASLASAATPVPTGTSTPDPLAGLPRGRLNILIMGTDKRANDPDHYARSDTMILLNLDTTTHRVGALSIPRDLVATVPGYGVNKVNSAYLFGEYYHEPGGGQVLAAETISRLFNVPIDYYLTINFEGFRQLIDMIGGINVDVPYALDDYHYPSDDQGDLYGELHVHFDAGWQHMDGKTALRYARTRHADNDFMRSKRQLQVVVAARQSAMSVNLIPRLPSIIDQLGGMVETDIPFDKQLSLANFAYALKSTDIYTATIGSDLISAVTLDDGSEGLQLDWQAARPVLDDFFGRTDIGPALEPSESSAGGVRTPSAVAPGKVRRTGTATPGEGGGTTQRKTPVGKPTSGR